MAPWVRCGLSVASPFVCRCLNSLTMLRFHIPLVEPDVRISRSRLSEKRVTMSPTGDCASACHSNAEFIEDPHLTCLQRALVREKSCGNKTRLASV
jgi:hypothetical protein